ncbi:MAG: hypothetical protein ACYC2G_12945 [Gemmatimonadaceae bacterium]
MIAHIHRTLAGAVVLALSLTACNKGDGGDTAMRDVPPPTTSASQAAAIQVTDLEVGRALGPDGGVVEDIDDFAAGDTIYAVAHTTGMASGATLTARWTYGDGQVVDESSQTISPTGPARTEFHVSKAGGWPAGDYKVTIMLDGREVESEEFKVGG